MPDHDKEEKLIGAVRQAYSAAADRPRDRHAFPVGRQFAESVGYPKDLLDGLPEQCVEAFAGVSNLGITAEIPEGSVVLDLGCGAGLDALIAAKRSGQNGSVIGIDFSEPMIARARSAAADARQQNIEFRAADAADLPVPDRSIDVALVNGIFNLNPRREGIFRELARVVRPGGHVYAAELVLKDPGTARIEQTPANWFA
jgi:SAM-dependent methyltransferase